MTENQKLREALQALLERYVELVNSGDAGNWDPEAEREVIAARQALALPTAAPVGEIHKQCPTCNWPLDAHDTDEPCKPKSAPVGERQAFEQVIVEAGGSDAIRRWPNEKGESYENARVQDYRQGWLWCIEWQARAALSAGDAVDAQMYRWLMDNCTLGIKQNGVGWSLNTTACIAPDCIKDVGATIDAAMRKGQM